MAYALVIQSGAFVGRNLADIYDEIQTAIFYWHPAQIRLSLQDWKAVRAWIGSGGMLLGVPLVLDEEPPIPDWLGVVTC